MRLSINEGDMKNEFDMGKVYYICTNMYEFIVGLREAHRFLVRPALRFQYSGQN